MAYINGKQVLFSPLQPVEFDTKLQASKAVEITENGTVNINVDSGYDGMVKVVATVNVVVKDWQAGVVYNPDEIVIYNGVYYVCIKTTQGFLDDPESFPDEWQKISSGGGYMGEYSEGASYSKGDLVTCDGNLYEAKCDNPLTPPNNDMVSHWNKLTYNVNPSGTKQITTNGLHDVAGYVSAEVNVESNSGYRGEYDDSTAYKIGDIVTYQGNVYMCGSDMSEGGHNPVDESIYWGGNSLNTPIEQYKGEYDDSVAYKMGDIVTYQGNVYQCGSDMSEGGNNPVDMGIYWNGGTPLNTPSASGSTFVIPAGTYNPKDYSGDPFLTPSFNSLIPTGYNVSAKVTGYATAATGETVMFDKIEMYYREISLCLSFYSDSTWLGHNHLYDGGYKPITINNDTEVDSLFYMIFMDLYSAQT